MTIFANIKNGLTLSLKQFLLTQEAVNRVV